MPNSKSVALTAFNAQIVTGLGLRDPFRKKVRDHVGTVPGNMAAKFQARNLNRFEKVVRWFD